MKKLLPYVLAFFAALAAAALLWALRLRCPAPLTDVLSPVYGSPWELGKAAFFPLLCAAPLLWGLQRGGSRSSARGDGNVRAACPRRGRRVLRRAYPCGHDIRRDGRRAEKRASVRGGIPGGAYYRLLHCAGSHWQETPVRASPDGNIFALIYDL